MSLRVLPHELPDFGDGWRDGKHSQPRNPGERRGESREAYLLGFADGRTEFAEQASISVPYKEFCRDLVACAGKSQCPRDPTCAD